MVKAPSRGRSAKGVNYIDLIKLLKIRRRTHGLGSVSPQLESLMRERLLPSAWYPFTFLQELLELAYKELLDRDPRKALQMGIAGGRAALAGVHRVFLIPGDAMASTLAMRHTWTSYFDFGELTAVMDGDDAVLFTLTGYEDMPEHHGMMIAGWHLSPALACGVKDARTKLLACPWKGDRELIHRVTL